MPQLTPFYFINEITIALILFLALIYIFSKYILPMFLRLFLVRTLINIF